MNRYQKDAVLKQHNRSQDIQVSNDTKNKIEAIAVAHLAAGNTTEFAMAMNTLGKIDTQAEIMDQIDKLSGAIQALQAQSS
tara:strand:+ start:214 stop:456 length:243 start_codon:yes stop_codon:yes gene_type:complete